MSRRSWRYLFLAIGLVFIVLTLAAYPDLYLASVLALTDVALMTSFLVAWFATRPGRPSSGPVPEAAEPRDRTTGRLD